MRAETYRWELIPLRFSTPLNESVPEDASGKLIVFHPPTPGVTYSIGVDTSQGKGADSTVISVWSVGEGTQQDQQCAEFASPYVNHVEAFSFILCIAAYYAQYMEQGVTRWKEPLVSIEQLAAVGDTAQNQMKQMGYKNFNRFSRYDGKNPAKSKRMATRNGWFTTAWSRPLLLVNYITCAKNNWSQINSPWLINEMKHFEVHVTATGKEKLEHEEDEHDDRIFAAAIAIFCPHDMDKLASRSNNRLTELVSAPPIDLSPYRGQVITQSQLRNSSELTLNDLIYTNRRR
jgi:hypothetical protein